jgi:hypothetical protein
MAEAIPSTSRGKVHHDSFPNTAHVRERQDDDHDIPIVTELIDSKGFDIYDPPPLSCGSSKSGRRSNRNKKQKGSSLLGRLRIIKATSSGCSRRPGSDRSSAAPPKEVVVVDGQRGYCASPASCSNRDARQHHKLVEELLASYSHRVVTLRRPCRFTFDVVPSMSIGDSSTSDGTTSTADEELLVETDGVDEVYGDHAGSEATTAPSPKNEISILDDLANIEITGSRHRSSHTLDKHHSKQPKVHSRPRSRTSSTELTSCTTASTSKDSRYGMSDKTLTPNPEDRSGTVMTIKSMQQVGGGIGSGPPQKVAPAATYELAKSCGQLSPPSAGLPHGKQSDVKAGDNIVSFTANGDTSESTSWFSFSFFVSWFF